MGTRLGTNINMQCVNSAALQSWAGEIEATFTAAGWVRTGDTGQTLASALVYPAAVHTPAGNQIWRMADTLQATVPVYVKIEYGEGTTAYEPAIWLTIGTGSDGSGNITGILFPRYELSAPSGNYSAAVPTYGSGSTSRVNWAGGDTHGHLLFSIERTRDGNGTYTNEGVEILMSANNTNTASFKFCQELRFTNNTLPNSTTLNAFVPSGTTWGDSGDVGACPVRFNNGGVSNPSGCWLTYLNADLAAGVSIPVTMYGGTKNFMPLGTGILATAVPGNSNATLMMRWD